MLQAPSHLSRVCGHSHIKKFWLTQMQNESQTCENKSGLVPSCSRPVCGFSAKGPESKQRNSAGSSTKSFLTGVSSSGRHARPVVSGAITVNGGHGAASAAVRRVSLATCAESLSPLRCSNQIYRSCQTSSPDLTNCNVEEENNGLDAAEELDCSSFKVPFVGDISASSSRCGSPSGDPEARHADHDVAENVVEAQFAKISNVKRPIGSQPATDGRDPLSSWGNCRAIGEGTGYAYQEERVELFKRVDNDSSENHSVELENSDSGTDAGYSDIAGSPVRGSRTGVFDTSGTSISRRAGSIGWTLAAASQKRESEKRTWSSGACTEEFSINHREPSPENENLTHHSTLRVCTLCGTTKTLLWRSGPLGPKSLCNACGIRFKKSRRCAGHSEGSEPLASPLGSSGSFRPSYRPLKRKQDTLRPCEAYLSGETGADPAVMEASFQHQKRSRWPDLTVKKDATGHIGEIAGSSAESCLTWNLLPSSSRSASVRKLDLQPRSRIDLEKLRTGDEDGTKNRATSNEEEEAALLLMYLSYGFVYA